MYGEQIQDYIMALMPWATVMLGFGPETVSHLLAMTPLLHGKCTSCARAKSSEVGFGSGRRSSLTSIVSFPLKTTLNWHGFDEKHTFFCRILPNAAHSPQETGW
jgi:hypothetical protein